MHLLPTFPFASSTGRSSEKPKEKKKRKKTGLTAPRSESYSRTSSEASRASEYHKNQLDSKKTKKKKNVGALLLRLLLSV